MATVLDIAPGSSVRLTVTKQPTNEAAVKTIRRLLLKDPGHAKDNQRVKGTLKRGLRQVPRGGRLWNIRVVKPVRIRVLPGDTGVIKATPSVLRDLPSVTRFVKLEAA